MQVNLKWQFYKWIEMKFIEPIYHHMELLYPEVVHWEMSLGLYRFAT